MEEKMEHVAVNKHHMWWERNWYTERNDKRLRQLGGFVVPTTVYTHQLLHAQMRPMVKPTAQLRNDIIDFAMSVPQTDRFNIPLETASWLEKQHDAHHSDEYAYRALRLAHHLRQQVGYLAIHELPIRARYGV
jgi:hypothetical protein